MALFAKNLAPASTDRALGSAVIQRSLRFNSTDNTSLNRTPSSASNRKTWTWSSWVKRDQVSAGTNRYMFMAGQTDGNDHVAHISFDNNDRLRLYSVTGSFDYKIRSNSVYRDNSSWYHVVVAFDSTQSTASNRVKMYVNGSQVTDLGQSDYPSQNHDSYFNNNVLHNIGRYNAGTTQWYQGYMAEINFVDGYAYDPSSFGFTDPQTGIWMPKRYEGTYGTNGFYLDFSDNSSTAALGIDKSPNGNDWTTNNFSVSAGVGNDSLEDTPTNNFCTLNKLNTIKYNANYDTIVDQGGLLMRGGDNVSPATMLYPKSGKWYCEFSKYGNGYSQGVSVVRADTDIRNLDGVTSHSSKVTLTTYPELLVRGSNVSNNGTAWDNDADAVIGVAVDMDNGAMYFAINNTWINSGVPTSGSAKTGAVATDLLTVNDGHHYVAAQGFNGNDNAGMYANFGQQAFAYTPPSGYKTLSTKNLPPNSSLTIRPQRYFDTLLYTGTGSSNIVEGLEFSPDMVWVKGRDTNGTEHAIIDSVRGGTKSVVPNASDSESTHGGRSMTFYNRGVRWNSDSNICNANGENYVLWCWKAGGAAVANSDGATASQVSAKTEAGFSIVTYTGTGSSTTIGHGLGKKPEMIFMKSRSASGDWAVLDKTNTTAEYTFYLNDNNPYGSSSGYTFYADTPPTSSVWTVNSASATNASGVNYVAYCWTSIPGYSKIGSYEGTENADGAYVYLGFRPAWVLFKRNDYSGNWFIVDNKRDVDNESTRDLYPNTAGAETNNPNFVDFLSDGFKLRTTGTAVNAGTIIYMAFAEGIGTTPFDTFPNAR